jgi:hypothetical protein
MPKATQNEAVPVRRAESGHVRSATVLVVSMRRTVKRGDCMDGLRGKRAPVRKPEAEPSGDLPGVTHFGGCASATAAEPPGGLVER